MSAKELRRWLHSASLLLIAATLSLLALQRLAPQAHADDPAPSPSPGSTCWTFSPKPFEPDGAYKHVEAWMDEQVASGRDQVVAIPYDVEGAGIVTLCAW